MHIDAAGWLVEDDEADFPVIRIPTKRTTALEQGLSGPAGVVLHTTDDPPGPRYLENLCKRIQDFPIGLAHQASFHLGLGRFGAIYQTAPMTLGTWHCRGQGRVAGKWRWVNRSTVGIEIEAAGRLKLVDGQWRAYDWTDPKRVVDAETVEKVPGDGYFQRHTPEQEDMLVAIWRAGAARFGWTRDVVAYSHKQFDPKRREDPGPLVMRRVPALLERAFG